MGNGSPDCPSEPFRAPRRGMSPGGRRPKSQTGRLSWLLGSWSGPAASSYERRFVSNAEVAIDPARVRRP